jgi:ABC-type microcin C transport system permease subunit YejB
MFWGLAHLSKDSSAYVLASVLIGMGLIAAAFVFACLSIRCTACGARWVWMGVSGKSSREWLAWLLSRSECPVCKPKEEA